MGKGRNQIIGVALAGGIVALFASGLGRESVRRDVGPEVDKVAADPRDKCRWPGGSIHNFAGQVQRMLRNPPSFEHVETVVGPIEGDRFKATMTYRATNGYGAVDTGVAVGEVRVGDCAARVISI